MKHLSDYLEPEQVHAMLDAAQMSSQRDYLIIKTMWETGMRASELLALTPADIERKHEVITITNGKGGKERRVLVKSETVKELFSYASQKGLGNGAKLFPLKRRQLYNIIRKYGAFAGVAVHPHAPPQLCDQPRAAQHRHTKGADAAGSFEFECHVGVSAVKGERFKGRV
jgi:integrase/recombinase XerD